MNNEHYEYVLKDLISQRDELNILIKSFQKRLGKSSYLEESSPFPHVPSYMSSSSQYAPFAGLQILPAIKKLLKESPIPLKATEIADNLAKGGISFSTNTPSNTIASVLSRCIQDHDPDITKIDRGLWHIRK